LNAANVECGDQSYSERKEEANIWILGRAVKQKNSSTSQIVAAARVGGFIHFSSLPTGRGSEVVMQVVAEKEPEGSRSS
jgi:hypothetical protein